MEIGGISGSSHCRRISILRPVVVSMIQLDSICPMASWPLA
jgi:hypothetical protein